MKPFTENVVFLDTEFSSLDPYIGEILSIGLITLDGREMYMEVEHEGEASDWVKEHIVPTLTEKKISREEACQRMRDFLGNSNPFLITYVSHYDTLYLRKLFGEDDQPYYWLPIDFGSILFGYGIDPERYLKNTAALASELGIDVARYRQHHALDDAKMLRDIYKEFFRTR